jgi:type IV secretion system protein VirB11
MSGPYLEAWLAPLLPVLARAEVSDLYINRPGELWVEALGGVPQRVAMPELDEERLWRIARAVASLSHQGISREHPLLGHAARWGAGAGGGAARHARQPGAGYPQACGG